MFQRTRFTESRTRHFQLYVRRTDRRRCHCFRRLATGMADLHPQMRVIFRAGFGISAQAGNLFIALLAFNHNIAGAFQIAMVNLHIAGQQNAGTALCPAFV